MNRQNETYADKVKERLRKKVDREWLGGTLKRPGKSAVYNHPDIFREPGRNLMDGLFPIPQSVKGTLTEAILNDERVGHLVSSLAMCISYFKRFFLTPAGETAFLRILTRLGINLKGAEIQNAAFELLPSEVYRNDSVKHPYDQTHFDFFLELTDGRRIFWEIKYTEAGFGKISASEKHPDRYVKQWQNVYSKLYQTSAYRNSENPVCTEDYICLKEGRLTACCAREASCAIHEFFSHYQIRRNIVWAQHADDHVFFLTPRENTSLDTERAYIETYANQYGKGYIHNLYWEELLFITLEETAGDSLLHHYYLRFKNKYLD